jgi:hypothetical protein
MDVTMEYDLRKKTIFTRSVVVRCALRTLQIVSVRKSSPVLT